MTGGAVERADLRRSSPYWGEHRSRYRLASALAKDAVVLDIACGTGFGAPMLRAAGARRVIAVDLYHPALAAAGVQFGMDAIFVRASGTSIPLRTGSCHLVTSFETLEHIEATKAFLAELRRVLCPSGALLLSTPNRDYTELNGQTCTNPFHIREYTGDELRNELQRHFSRVTLVGQRLSPEYRVSPFEADHRRRVARGRERLRLLWWKLQNKLPFSVKNALSRLVSGHAFYPDEEHYLFTASGIETAPVLVATCQP